ncbi:MAG: hypothetical protein B7Z49_00530, partial [Hydrogenophilales bacterium 12-63-5]
MRPTSDHAGFTLIEMIIVIAITAIVGSMVAVFLRAPLESYVAQDRRALPNSVRVTTDAAGVVYLEFLGTRSGGRYLAQGSGDILDFTVPDNGFDVLGPGIDMKAGDLVAVYNLGITGADAWAGNTLAAYAGAPGNVTHIAIASKQFPLASPGNRFQVVEGPVTYACAPNPANPALGTLTRYWGYAIAAAQPTPPAPASSALLATNVSACSFTYQ